MRNLAAWRAGLGRALTVACLAAAAAAMPASAAPPLTRPQALQGLAQSDAARRVAALERLAEVGTMADVERVARHLRGENESERETAAAALWVIWSRSGDAGIDQLFSRGTALMSRGELPQALALFDEIVRLKPAFAEGWNKRATVLFLLGRDAESLRDCDEVLKRNPHHFGALSGMAQIHMRGGNLEGALVAYERALKVNPNLLDGAQTLRRLEEAVRAQRRAAGLGRT